MVWSSVTCLLEKWGWTKPTKTILPGLVLRGSQFLTQLKVSIAPDDAAAVHGDGILNGSA